MEAVVLGGGGLTGRCTVRDLAAGGGFDAIRVADLDLGLAAAAARATGASNVTAERLDVREPAALRRILKGADVCVNAVQYTFNLAVMDGCLAEGVPYLDFGGLFHMTRRQLAQDSRFKEAGLVAIPGFGQVPGVSNVLTVAAAADLERVDSVIIRDGWRDLTPNGPEVVFTWSPSTFLDEMLLEAMVFDDGAYVAHPPMSGAEAFDFPEPVGRTTVYRTLHSEPATLPHSLRAKGIRHCEWKEGGPGIDLLRTMAKLGLGSDTPVDVHGQPVVPREFLLALLKREKLLGAPDGVALLDWEVCDIEVRGHHQGKPVERHAQARFPPRPDWGFTATEYAVGVAGAIGARLIVEGAVTETGVVPPEIAVPAGPLRAALRAHGIETTIRPTEPELPPFVAER
jgi:saccharopine dehydrogenase-like NADP-dependent oxidoreductase